MAHREYTKSSGNVFADLGLPKPDDLLAKAELAARIIEEIHDGGSPKARPPRSSESTNPKSRR